MAFNPASLGPQLWVRGSYVGSPWVPVVGGNLTEATNPPSAGATLNGYAPADFDGTNDRLAFAGTGASYFSTGAMTGLFLVKVNSAAVHVSDTANEAVLATQGTGRLNLTVTDDGAGTRTVRFRTFNGVGSDAVAMTIAEAWGSWMLVKFKADGTKNYIGKNGGAFSEAAASPIDRLSDALWMGVSSFDTSNFFDGEVMEAMLFNTLKSTADITNYISYLNSRYGLALT